MSHFCEINGQCRKFASVIKISQVLSQLHGFIFSLYYIFKWLLTVAFLEAGRSSFKLLTIFEKKAEQKELVADVQLVELLVWLRV